MCQLLYYLRWNSKFKTYLGGWYTQSKKKKKKKKKKNHSRLALYFVERRQKKKNSVARRGKINHDHKEITAFQSE